MKYFCAIFFSKRLIAATVNVQQHDDDYKAVRIIAASRVAIFLLVMLTKRGEYTK
jgi:hypothetical protein